MPKPLVKICGITRPQDAHLAVELGASFLGFIFYPASPRYITPIQACEIIRTLPLSVKTVAVMVEPQLHEIEDLLNTIRIDFWQLHGSLNSELFTRLSPPTCIQAVGMPMSPDFPLHPEHAHAFLLDKASSQHGGTGKTFDWSLATEWKKRHPNHRLFLAGGLNADNIQQAIELVQPDVIDINSGVESAPGIKDHFLLRKLFEQ